MTTEKHDPWALLAEAREAIPCQFPNDRRCRCAGCMTRARIDAALAEQQNSAKDVVEPKDSDWTLLPDYEGIIVAALPNDEMLSVRPNTNKYGTAWAWFYGGLAKTEAEAKSAAIAAARGLR